jgi:hypothetical protein
VPVLPLPPKIHAESSADPRFQFRELLGGLAEAEVAAERVNDYETGAGSI